MAQLDTIVPSLIRTYTPIAVGAAVTWLASLGLTLDTPTTAALTVVLGGLASALYYTLVRLLEQRWPVIGALLGSAKSPDSYSVGNPAPGATGLPADSTQGQIESAAVPVETIRAQGA